jgi:hypothetical protein
MVSSGTVMVTLSDISGVDGAGNTRPRPSPARKDQARTSRATGNYRTKLSAGFIKGR